LLPGLPDRVAANPKWGPYLHARSHLVAQLANQVRLNTAGEAQAWAAQLHTLVSAELIADVQVWRAATSRSWQQQLDNRLAARLPTQMGNGGNCSPPKLLEPRQTQSCRSRQKS
jgi:hypothetical protein